MKPASLLVVLALLSSPCLAEETRAVPRLLQDGDGAVIRITLAAGYKTYWRMPGETGVAPRFDWQGSQNLKSAVVDMPAPRRHADPDGDTVGYAGAVDWPVRIEAADPARPVQLKLLLDYAVCEKLCIPLQASLAGEPAPQGTHAAALAQLPRPLDGVSARLVPQGLEVALPVAAEDIFVEPEGVLAYFRKPERVAEGRYLLPGVGDFADLAGKTLRLTIISQGAGFVSSITVQ